MKAVYVLTNVGMPGIVKIGKTTQSVESRMRDLDTTGIPYPFECFYAAEVADENATEKKVHEVFADKRIRPSREFFEVDAVQARAAVQLACIKDVTPRSYVFDDPDDLLALEREAKKRPRFKMTMAGVSPGEKLSFVYNEEIVAVVIDEEKIEFEGGAMSLSASALIAAKQCGYDWKAIAGPEYWLYKGESLAALRMAKEKEG